MLPVGTTIDPLRFLHGMHTLGMSGCTQNTVTDAAFAHLRGIHTLYMGSCSQTTTTDAAFVHLRGLPYTRCTWAAAPRHHQAAAIPHLRGIHKLSVHGCSHGVREAAMAQQGGIDAHTGE
jgi:hypothetical protein